MVNNSETRTSFYKFLNDHDFTSQLRLPPEFVKDHGKNLSEKAKLLTESGHSWIVKTEQIGNNRFFTDGWSRFADYAHLKRSEFLLFKLIGNSKFEVSVYETSACKRELHSPGYNVPRTINLGIKEVEECDFTTHRKDVSRDVRNWKFVKTLTRDHTSELEIPRDFALSTGIVEKRKMKVRIGKGKGWPVHVKCTKGGMFRMTGGWNEFLRGNKVVIGSTVSFEFVRYSSPGNYVTVVAKVVEKGKYNELFASAKRKRGRPPKLNGS